VEKAICFGSLLQRKMLDQHFNRAFVVYLAQPPIGPQILAYASAN
jgi:hypothetical protein